MLESNIQRDDCRLRIKKKRSKGRDRLMSFPCCILPIPNVAVYPFYYVLIFMIRNPSCILCVNPHVPTPATYSIRTFICRFDSYAWSSLCNPLCGRDVQLRYEKISKGESISEMHEMAHTVIHAEKCVACKCGVAMWTESRPFITPVSFCLSGHVRLICYVPLPLSPNRPCWNFGIGALHRRKGLSESFTHLHIVWDDK